MVKTVDVPSLETADEFDLLAWVEGLNLREEEQALVIQACNIAKDSVNRSGNGNSWGEHTNCYLIGLEIAATVAGLQADQTTIIAAILCRCVREGRLANEFVAQAFGEDVAKLIQGINLMDAITVGMDTDEGSILGQSQSQVDNLRRMLITIIDDVRVVLLKLAERCSALRNLKPYPDRARKVAKEVSAVFSPLAHRLGIGHLKWELEDLSFRYLNPKEYSRIASLLDGKRLDREGFIQDVLQTIEQELSKENIAAEVNGRVKHIYSIWRKMQRKKITFAEVHDIRAVRVLVDSQSDCYKVMGIVHRLWWNIPHEFDDYIANPKSNGYQSLHTAVIGPQGKILEIQIRTHDMHLEAEYGVCAHWAYKGADNQISHRDSYEQKIAWLRQVLEWQDEIDGKAGLEGLSSEVSEDRIYVFTPKGHVVDLPKKSTPLDFAYHIHTEVGHKCRGAKVNGRIVPLTYALKTGERVNILTGTDPDPSRDWLRTDLGYCQSSRTRSKIQQWFRLQNRETNLTIGRSLVEKELRQLDVNAVDYKEIATAFKKDTVEDLWLAVGIGDITVNQLVNVAEKTLGDDEEPELDLGEFTYNPKADSPGEITVQGVGNLLTTIAACCNPVNGDAIVGYVTQGRGVSIHQQDCIQMLDLQAKNPERVIKVNWGETTSTYPVNLLVESYDRHALLSDITAVMARNGINVTGMNSNTDHQTNIATMRFNVEVSGLNVLSSLIGKLKRLPNVLNVERVRNG